MKARSWHYRAYWISGVLILLTYLVHWNQKIDLQMHDTYVIFGASSIGIVFFLLFLLFGLCNFILARLNRKLSFTLTNIHCFGTFGILLMFNILTIWNNMIVQYKPRRYYSISDFDSILGTIAQTNFLITLSAIVFILLQLVFLANILLALSSKHQ